MRPDPDRPGRDRPGSAQVVRVMIVDDHPIWRDGTARYLAEAGYEVAATAGDGAQAVRIVAAARPDVVLLDLNLPDQPGAEVTRQLLAAHPPARILMLSASGQRDDVLRLVAVGLTYPQIAARLTLSVRTVQNHVQNTLAKLQLHNKAQLVRYALENNVNRGDDAAG